MLRPYQSSGITLIELLLALALLSILSTVAYPSYRQYVDQADSHIAIGQISTMSLEINGYAFGNGGVFPSTLADVGLDNFLDPWGNPYQYTNIASVKGKGSLRKDRSLVPINSDYDLYSKGPDGRSVSPLTAKHSRDDIVRANNGGFVGIAEDY